MKGPLTVITGATSGIGYQTALQLANRGHRLILVFRSVKKGDQARKSIKSEVSDASIDLVVADLSIQQEIRAAAIKINQITPMIDVLVNNVGTWHSKRAETEDSIEKVFAVNHLSYFLFTNLLYTSLARSQNARIINVSSDSHFKAKMHFDNLNLSKNYHGLRSYAQSKLANILFTYEFEKRKPHEHVLINAVQPGLVKTNIGFKHTNWLHSLAWKLRRSSGITPMEGASTSVYLASSPEVDGVSAKYWADCQQKASSKSSYNAEDACKLWEVSEKMCGITHFFESNENH